MRRSAGHAKMNDPLGAYGKIRGRENAPPFPRFRRLLRLRGFSHQESQRNASHAIRRPLQKGPPAEALPVSARWIGITHIYTPMWSDGVMECRVNLPDTLFICLVFRSEKGAFSLH